MVRFVEGASVPTVVVAVDRTIFVAHPNVAKDLCVRGISSGNFWLSMKEALRLKEIDGADDVGRDCRGFVKRFADCVDLDGERDGNLHLPQLAGERGGLSSAPALAIDDDCGAVLLKGRDGAVMVGVEEALDVVQGFSSLMISEDFGVD